MRLRDTVKAAAGALALGLVATPASATDVMEILSRMRGAVEPGKDMRAMVEFTMTNAKGESVVWSGRVYRKSGKDARMRIVFDSPLDLRGTEVMLHRAPDGVSQARVYLPAIRRVRDLAGDLRGESFLSTDFNYEDLGFAQMDYQQHVLQGNGDTAGRDCYRIESVPDRGWWYGKIIRCIDKKDYLPRRTEYYDRAGILWKVRTFNDVRKVGAYSTATRITMQTVPTGTTTEISFADVEYDVGLPDSILTGP